MIELRPNLRGGVGELSHIFTVADCASPVKVFLSLFFLPFQFSDLLAPFFLTSQRRGKNLNGIVLNYDVVSRVFCRCSRLCVQFPSIIFVINSDPLQHLMVNQN